MPPAPLSASLSAPLVLDPDVTVAPVSRRLFGAFVEHLGRGIYGGIYEPGHPTADAAGFRGDVAALVRELGVSTIRYPGGNFVSGYRWEDGVGPRDRRPTRLDLAWHSTETNEIGLHEFADWLDLIGSDLMLAVNLGTRGIQEALDLLEYANLPAGTTLAEQRIANGRTDPFDVRTWCLGNEMDGPWQLGHRSAEDYGALAAQTARAMRAFDPDLELVACGSSGAGMPTFGTWERTVLERCGDVVDLISCHAYYENTGDLPAFLASGAAMDRFIKDVAAAIDDVAAVRPDIGEIGISFDEWNVWSMTKFENVDKVRDPHHWPVAPPLLEDVYTVADAVVVGGLLITLLRNSDRVAAASLAQLVNVIAPIMTETGGPAWRQTTFHPFALTSQYAAGSVLRATPACPTYDADGLGEAGTGVGIVDAVATYDAASRELAVFAVNRSTDQPVQFDVDLGAFGHSAPPTATATTVTDADPLAVNTRDEPDRVGPEPIPVTATESSLGAVLPPVSWTIVRATLPE